MKFFNFYFVATILIILCACKKEESFNDENQIQIEFSKETVLATCFYSKICQISLNELKYIKLKEEIISDQMEVNSAHDSCAIVSYSLDTSNNFIQQLNIIYNAHNYLKENGIIIFDSLEKGYQKSVNFFLENDLKLLEFTGIAPLKNEATISGIFYYKW